MPHLRGDIANAQPVHERKDFSIESHNGDATNALLVALSKGEMAEAEGLAQESLAIAQGSGNRWSIALGLHIKGRIEARRKNVSAARNFYE